MSVFVKLSPAAEADLERLFDFLFDRAETTEVLDRAQAAIVALRATAQLGCRWALSQSHHQHHSPIGRQSRVGRHQAQWLGE